MNTKKTVSSGNVFLDLGFEPHEARTLQLRAELMADLKEQIKLRDLTQTEAALILGVAQSRVSDLVRGKWELFSLETLIAMESRFGRSIELRIETL
jgi:predicted XRE-type DNA-binding protein